MDKKTFTKRAVKWLLILGAINGTLPFVLSAFGREPVAEMGIAWITEIVSVTLGYLLKAYFETKTQRKQDLEDYLAKNEINTKDEGGEEENGADDI